LSFDQIGGGSTPRTPSTPIAVGSATGTAVGSATAGSAEKVVKKKEPMRKCRVCKKMFPVANWPLCSSSCRDCKQALDNIANAVKKQNQQEWWASTKENELELQKVVAKYQEYCPQPTPGTGTRVAKRGSFCIVRYVEKFASQSGVLYDDQGKMMQLSMYLDFAQKPSNPEGALTKQQAEARWEELLAEPLTQRIRDQNGPASEPVRLRISTGDMVKFRNGYMHTREQEMQSNKDEKNVSLEKIEAGRKSLLRDADSGLGRHGEHGDMAAIAQSMVSGSSNGGRAPSKGAFAGTGVYEPILGNLREDIQEDELDKQKKKDALKKKKLHPTAPEDGEPSAEGDGEATGSGATSSDHTPTTAKPKLFDESSINKAKRTQEAAHGRLAELLNKSYKSGLAALADIDALPAEEAKHYSLEKGTVAYRMKFLMTVLHDPKTKEDMLLAETELIALIQDARTKRPPSEDYERLELLANLRLGQTVGFVDLVDAAKNTDDVLRMSKALELRRVPMNNLAKSVAKASMDLLGARKSRKRVAEQKAGSAAKKARVAVTPDQALVTKHIFAMDGLEPFASRTNAVKLYDEDMDMPFIMNMPALQKKLQAGPCPLLFVVVVVAKEVTVIVVDLVLLV
jgi:hypothetical protein